MSRFYAPTDWDSIYQGDPKTRESGPVPWNLDEPQPELAKVIERCKDNGDALDAGCGHGAISLLLVEQGRTVVGLDISPTAIAAARELAHKKGLRTVSYEIADITSFTGYENRFGIIVDSTLFHSLPEEAIDGYQRVIFRAAAPGASYFVLVFKNCSFPDDCEFKPHEYSREQLHEKVGRCWTIDEIRESNIHFYPLGGTFGLQNPEFTKITYPFDDKGRWIIPSWLLIAHKPGGSRDD
jgi:SAM-dependent methyltransferase